MIHIGSVIEKELRRQGQTATWFARELYCNRQNVYNIFKRKSIDTDLLMRISLVLHCNFFEYFIQGYKAGELGEDQAPADGEE